MNILFTICARKGSKGFKNKNLKIFLGYPLSFYSVSVIDLYMQKNPEIDCDIVLNTDSEDLIKLFKENLKIKVYVINREPSLGQDKTPKVSVILNSYRMMQEKKKRNYDMIVDLDITSPLRTIDDLENLINKKNQTDADVIFSVSDSRRNPYFNMVKKTEHGYKKVIDSPYNTRQEAPEIFDMNASLYAYTPSFLMTGRGIFEGKCDVIKMIDTGILDIDSENDFNLMQVIAEYLFLNNKGMSQLRDNIQRIIK